MSFGVAWPSPPRKVGGFTRQVSQRDQSNRLMWDFVLRGPRGATTFTIWGLACLLPDGISRDGFMPIDLSVHCPARSCGRAPEWCTHMADCPWLDGVECCYDGTSLGAVDVMARWSAAGRDDEVIWRELEAWYRARFDG